MKYISMDRYNEMQERAMRAEAERDAAIRKDENAQVKLQEAESVLGERIQLLHAAEAERDALRAVVKALVEFEDFREPGLATWHHARKQAYDAARAKVGMP